MGLDGWIKSTIRKRKTKQRLLVSVALLMLLLLSVVCFYRPTMVKFYTPQIPISHEYTLEMYISRPNDTGGITMERHILTFEEHQNMIDNLSHVSLSRRIVDWHDNSYNAARYDIGGIPSIRDSQGVYLSEMRLYVDHKGNHKSFIIVTADGRTRTYGINDEAEIEKLISIIESFIDME